ncbi:MAG: sigma-54-dependent Fis family transcriptional regulator [Bacteroidales bacterium]|nr:sigma-54-dependent Fis family transcriptional regulator [Bacteroidales bacterium]
MDAQELQSLKNKFDIVGNDPALNLALETAVKFAPTDLTVLVTGESGVGKENISKIIHQYSRRRGGKFIPVNCGGIPEGTINSELFGHVKGSFTGAIDNRSGYFEEANGGTIFLDEIAELPLQSQALLLRVLQSGEYMKVGSTKVEHTDVRVIAATNVNLGYAVSRGKFREDLYYRICAAQIRVPSLRERKDDIYLLFRKFTSDFSEKYGMCKISLTHEAISLLRSYPWPGNIRQLQGFTQSLTSLESQKVTPLSGRVEIDAQTLAQYMPAATETLPATVPGDGGAAPGNPEDMQKIVQAIVFLKQEVDALKQAVYHGHAAGHIPALPAASDEEPAPDRQPEEEDLSIKKITGEMIVRALEKHAGNRKLAARELGISERTLYRKLPAEYRSDNKNKR